jgi:hypothetical protein
LTGAVSPYHETGAGVVSADSLEATLAAAENLAEAEEDGLETYVTWASDWMAESLPFAWGIHVVRVTETSREADYDVTEIK